MYIRTSDADLIKMIPVFFCCLVGILIFVLLIYFFIRRQDNGKELVTKKVKILEKPVRQGNIEWYLVEFEDGNRLKLRSFQANNLIITEGDTGILSYRGITIESFQRQG